MKDNPEERGEQKIEDAIDIERDESETDFWPSRNHTEEDVIDWLEPLTKGDAPRLHVSFYSPSSGQLVNLPKEKFEDRLSGCLRKLELLPLPVELVDELFEMAVNHCQQMAAYGLFEKTLKEAEFNDTLSFIKRVCERMKLISKVLDMPRNPAVPPKIYEWKNVWVGSLRELVRTMNAQLHSAEDYMNNQKKWLKSGRTNLESHLLQIALFNIKAMLKRERLRTGSIALLVAYVHASQLVRYEDTERDGEPEEAMKTRMARVMKSKKKIDVLSLFHVQTLTK